jgi:hypothetical protein
MTSEKRKLEEEWLATRAGIRAKIQKSGPTMTQEEVEEWLAIRRDAGLQIDPETAEVEWIYALTVDPYGIYPELPEEYQQGAGIFRPLSGQRCLGPLWRPPRSDRRRPVAKV